MTDAELIQQISDCIHLGHLTPITDRMVVCKQLDRIEELLRRMEARQTTIEPPAHGDYMVLAYSACDKEWLIVHANVVNRCPADWTHWMSLPPVPKKEEQ